MPYYTNSQGLNIYYEVKGGSNDKTIVFMNGCGAPHDMNKGMVDALKSKYRCVVFDYRGYGNSDPSRFNSMAWCALDAKELIEHLELQEKKVTLMGASMGVSALLGYFKAYNDLYVDRIIICDQSPYVTSDGDWTHGRLQGQQDKNMILEEIQQMFHDPDAFGFEEMKRMSPDYYNFEYPERILEFSKKMFGVDWVPDDDAKRRIAMRGMAAGRKCDQLAYIATWFDSGYQDYRPVLPNIKVPALVLAPCPGSEYDFESNEYYRDHLGGPVDFQVFEPATHLLMFEYFPEVVAKICAFMDKEY